MLAEHDDINNMLKYKIILQNILCTEEKSDKNSLKNNQFITTFSRKQLENP